MLAQVDQDKAVARVFLFVSQNFVRIEFMEVNGYRQKKWSQIPAGFDFGSLTVKCRAERTFCGQWGRADKLLILRSD